VRSGNYTTITSSRRAIVANVVTFSGTIVGLPYFRWITHADGHRQAFLRFFVQLSGPRHEGDSQARIVCYGKQAEKTYEGLLEYPGTRVEVEGRYRVREEPETGEMCHEFVARHVSVLAFEELVPEGMVKRTVQRKKERHLD
jgi:single-stranded DNA-binding protein